MTGEGQLKKYIVFTMMAMVLGLAACNSDSKPAEDKNQNTNGEVKKNKEEGNQEKEKAPLELQVLKADEEAGATVDNHNIYQELNKLVSENPDVGEANDFSLYIVNTIHGDEGEVKLVLLGINRLPMAIKNLAFDFTLGNKEGEYVWNKLNVTMDEETAGALQPNSAFPIVLPLTPEQEELLRSLTEEDQVMKIENFTFDEV